MWVSQGRDFLIVTRLWGTYLVRSVLKTGLLSSWFFQDSVEYLGGVVSKEGIQTSKRKIEAILKVKTPTNQTELKSFLGTTIESLSGAWLISVLLSTTEEKCPVEFVSRASGEFCEDQRNLTSTEVLALFNPNVPLGLACDASGVGIGAVIYHKYEDGSERHMLPKPSQMQRETTPK